MLAVAKCGGPHIEFQPGRTDSAVFDPNARLPAPTEPLFHTVSKKIDGRYYVLLMPCYALQPKIEH